MLKVFSHCIPASVLPSGSSIVTTESPRQVTRQAITHAQKPGIPPVAQSGT